MLNVLHLAAGNLYGGVERIVATCATHRPATAGMRASFATCFTGRLASEVQAASAKFTTLGEVRVSHPVTVVRARRRLSELLGSDRPDIALCHSVWMFGLAAPVLRRLGVPAALWVHDRVSGRPWAERWAGLTRPDVIVCNSRFTAESIDTLYRGAAAAVVYAPVPRVPRLDAAERQTKRVMLGISSEDIPVVVIASRFERWKGHAKLLSALESVTGAWHLWIAGAAQRPHEHEYEMELRAAVSTRGFDQRVTFIGARTDMPEILQAADIHCQPNTLPEPFGLAFVEALQAGIPVITTASGGALEIVNDRCGILIPPGDTRALESALNDLLTSPRRRKALGATGPARAEGLCDPGRQLDALAAALAGIAA